MRPKLISFLLISTNITLLLKITLGRRHLCDIQNIQKKHNTEAPTCPRPGSAFSRHHNTSVFGVSNNWLRPAGLGSPIHHPAMKLFRSGGTPGLVPTNGRWKFEPGGAKQDFGGWAPAKSSKRAITRAMAGEPFAASGDDVADG